MNTLPFRFVYGNRRLIHQPNLAMVESVQRLQGSPLSQRDIDELEKEADDLVLDQNKILVTGIHNEAHQRASTIAMKWGCPQILVIAFDPRVLWFGSHLETMPDLFQRAKLWRHWFDSKTDLVLSISLSPIPLNKPGNAVRPCIDRIITEIASPAPVPLHQVVTHNGDTREWQMHDRELQEVAS